MPKLPCKNIKNSTREDVIHIVWPVLVELLLGSMFSMIDMMMLGRIRTSSLAAASVAAVGVTNQPLFIGQSLVQALNVGGTAMIARYLGSGKNEKIEITLKHVMILSLIVLAKLIFSTGTSIWNSIICINR